MKLIRRIVVAIVGGTVLLIGIVLIVLPVPSLVVIAAGLAILAIEFVWARHWLLKVRGLLSKKGDKKVENSTPDPGV